MRFRSLYGEDDGEHNGVSFVEIYIIFVTQGATFLCNRVTWRSTVLGCNPDQTTTCVFRVAASITPASHQHWPASCQHHTSTLSIEINNKPYPKRANSASDCAREMEFGSFDSRDDGQYNVVGFVEISKTFQRRMIFSFFWILFDSV